MLQVGLLNVDGFYDTLLTFFDKQLEEEFFDNSARNIVMSANTSSELLDKLEVVAILIHHSCYAIPALSWNDTDSTSGLSAHAISIASIVGVHTCFRCGAGVMLGDGPACTLRLQRWPQGWTQQVKPYGSFDYDRHKLYLLQMHYCRRTILETHHKPHKDYVEVRLNLQAFSAITLELSGKIGPSSAFATRGVDSPMLSFCADQSLMSSQDKRSLAAWFRVHDLWRGARLAYFFRKRLPSLFLYDIVSILIPEAWFDRINLNYSVYVQCNSLNYSSNSVEINCCFIFTEREIKVCLNSCFLCAYYLLLYEYLKPPWISGSRRS